MEKIEYQRQIQANGFALVPEYIAEEVLARLSAELYGLTAATAARRGQVYAARNLLESAPAVMDLAISDSILALVHPVLGANAFPVRALLFDKVPGANWHVGWHQDQVIAVRERKEVPGFTAWSVKRGVPHVRPPAEVLEKMLTLRVHLDDCGRDNGALRVIPGTHRVGVLDDAELSQALECGTEIVCEARRGSVLTMRPLVLHGSSLANRPSHRRVVHIEYAAELLPGGLRWPVYVSHSNTTASQDGYAVTAAG